VGVGKRGEGGRAADEKMRKENCRSSIATKRCAFRLALKTARFVRERKGKRHEPRARDIQGKGTVVGRGLLASRQGGLGLTEWLQPWHASQAASGGKTSVLIRD